MTTPASRGTLSRTAWSRPSTMTTEWPSMPRTMNGPWRYSTCAVPTWATARPAASTGQGSFGTSKGLGGSADSTKPIGKSTTQTSPSPLSWVVAHGSLEQPFNTAIVTVLCPLVRVLFICVCMYLYASYRMGAAFNPICSVPLETALSFVIAPLRTSSTAMRFRALGSGKPYGYG